MPQKSKQDVWRAAQIEEVDHFIAAIAKAFPDAIEVVVVEAKDNLVWWKKED
ncbi:hypothetical protein [Klebsiella phage ZCKP8]|uniref:hypothetical protein n=1 Tax=Klebsiella phage ZCKP8 TaxID=2852114 RepID=UPI001CE568F1|nr:hypothetical protein PRB87_gp09 [Klebsiella phage ZCKP8]QYW02884.1 hypothetical protein [Klebsiella phage ZCKP8]